MDDGKDLDSVALIDVFSEDDLLLSSSPGVAKSSVPLVNPLVTEDSPEAEYRSSSNLSPRVLVIGLGTPCGETSCLSFQGSLNTSTATNTNTSHFEKNISPIQFRDKSSLYPDPVPPLSDSPETLNSARRLNLRKSLAWDSAFFTSEGVLDPEELADVNSSFKNLQKQSVLKIPDSEPKSQRIVPQPKGLSKPPRTGSRIPILPSSRRPSVNAQSTQPKGLPGKGQPVTVTRRPFSVNSRAGVEKSKDTCQVKDQRRKLGAGKVKSEVISPSSSVESFTSESSSSSISLARRPVSSAPVPRTISLSRTQLTSKEVKPSGLRLPSPKLGYFEAGKSQPRSSDRNPQKSSRVNAP